MNMRHRAGKLSIAMGIGAVWGMVWMLVAGVIFMLATGLVITLPVSLAGLAGLLAGAGFMLLPGGSSGSRWLPAAGLPFLLCLVGSGPGFPFGLPPDEALPAQGGLALLLSGLVSWSIRQTLQDLPEALLNRYRLERVFIALMKGLGLVFFTVIVSLPFYVMLMTSLKSQQSLLANPLDFSIDLKQGSAGLLRSYVELFTDYRFGVFLVNSAVVSVATVLITLAFSIPGAYAVARLRFPGRAFLSRSILLIYMIPAIVLVIPLYAFFSQIGLRNTLTGLIVVYPATTIPVALYMLQGYFSGLPQELDEAGLMDGLSRLGVIARITMPLSLPALASVSLYVFMIAWNEFLFSFMFLDDPGLFTLSRGVVSLNSSEVPRQHLMAGAVIATVPVLILFLWFERFLVAGLTSGSVKG